MDIKHRPFLFLNSEHGVLKKRIRPRVKEASSSLCRRDDSAENIAKHMTKEKNVGLVQNDKSRSTPVARKAPEAREDVMEKWLQKLRRCCTDQIANIIETGKVLHEAKAELRGKWVKFKKSNASPYTPRKAEMLMRIVKNRSLCDAQHHAHLPEAWTVLHALAAIPDSKLAELIRAGQITPRLTLKSAKELDPNHKQKVPKPLSASGLARIKERIEESVPHWTSQPAEETGEVFCCLDEIQEQINAVKAEVNVTLH